MDLKIEKKEKKERTEAQKKAFERCLAARESALRKKIMEETASSVTEAREPVHDVKEEIKEEVKEENNANLKNNEVHMPCDPVHDVESEDDDDYDNSILDELNYNRNELSVLRQEIDLLKGAHTNLDQSFRQHSIRKMNELNFV